MQQTVELQVVQEDFVDRLATTRPVQALAELIWNSLDADSTTVRVEFDHDAWGLLQAIRVRDDGYGIVHEDAPKSGSAQEFGEVVDWRGLEHFSR